MAVVTQSEFRANMAKYLDQVEADAKELIITRSGKKSPMVVMPLEEVERWEATLHLLRSSKTADRLNESIARINRGQFQDRPEADLDRE